METLEQFAPKSRHNLNSRRNILIIEDDQDTANVIADILADHGYSTRKVNSRDKALEVLKIYLYDVIIMDLWMPGISAKEFVKQARIHHPYSRIILITANGTVQDQAMELGINRFVGKPFDPEKLIAAIETEV